MKKLIILIISILLLVIDNTILSYYAIDGIFPSLLFIFAIALSIIKGSEYALFIGILSGFLQDIFFFHGFGVNMLLNMLLCVLASVIGRGVFKENRLIPVLTCLLVSVLKTIGVIILFKLFSENIDIKAALGSSVLNSIVLLFVYKKILRLSDKYLSTDKWRFKW